MTLTLNLTLTLTLTLTPTLYTKVLDALTLSANPHPHSYPQNEWGRFFETVEGDECVWSVVHHNTSCCGNMSR